MKYLKVANSISLLLIAVSAFLWTINKSFANNEAHKNVLNIDKEENQIMTTGVGVDNIYAYYIEYKVEKDYTTNNWKLNHHLYKVEKEHFKNVRF